jgi:transcription antitermination factor NusG
MKEWYVIYMSNGNNRGVIQIQSMIDRLGFDAMLWSPTKKEIVTKYNKSVQNKQPLFPSYVFLNTEKLDNSKLEQSLVENKLGRFLKLPHDEHHDLPTPISQEDIDYIKSLEEADVEPVPEELVFVEVGDMVEVCVGPFMGVKGIVTQVIGHEVCIETLVFGRSAPVRINSAHLSRLVENNNEEANKG